MNYFTKENDFVSSPYIVFAASLDDKGRITVPSFLRRKFNLRKNSKILVRISKPEKIEKFKIESFNQLKKILNEIDDAEEIIFNGKNLIVIGGDTSG